MKESFIEIVVGFIEIITHSWVNLLDLVQYVITHTSFEENLYLLLIGWSQIVRLMSNKSLIYSYETMNNDSSGVNFLFCCFIVLISIAMLIFTFVSGTRKYTFNL